MPEVLKLKPTQKAVKQYYAILPAYRVGGVDKESTIRTAFYDLLGHCARKLGWRFRTEYGLSGKAKDEKKLP